MCKKIIFYFAHQLQSKSYNAYKYKYYCDKQFNLENLRFVVYAIYLWRCVSYPIKVYKKS